MKTLPKRSGSGKKTVNFFIILFFSFSLLACSDDEPTDCEGKLATEYVTEVDAPNSGQVKEPIEVEVQFKVHNSCGEFNRFIESGTGNSREIIVEAIYTGCVCAQVIETKSVTYLFEADEPGNYELRFQSGESEFITVEIVVEGEE